MGVGDGLLVIVLKKQFLFPVVWCFLLGSENVAVLNKLRIFIWFVSLTASLTAENINLSAPPQLQV